jgi:predicted alpha/beta hydrolase family esterase
MSASVLILHGWGGNKPAHWQEHLAAALAKEPVEVHYPKMPDPMSPNLAAWQHSLDEALKQVRVGPPLTVVCHSLGGINWMHYVTTVNERIADRVLLVAPPYVIPEIPPTDAPPGVSQFIPPPMDSAAIARTAGETHIIASNDDDYATFEQSKTYADRLQIPIHLLPGAGHISPYWGYGEWPWVVDWCLGRADLPPKPNK